MSEKVEKLAKEISQMSPAAQILVHEGLTSGAFEHKELDTETITATQSLIVRLSDQEEDLKAKKKDLNEMYRGIFDNDEELQKQQAELETQSKNIRERKTQLKLSAQASEIKAKIADTTEDLKLIQESLNTHLLNYFQLTGSQTVDFPGGDEREMIIRAKIKSLARASFNRNKPAVGQTDIFGGEVKE